MPPRAPRCALVLCPPWGVTTPPITLGTLAVHLEARGISASIHDLNLTLYSTAWEEDRPAWRPDHSDLLELDYCERFLSRYDAELGTALEQILAKDPDVVGFSINSTNKLVTLRLIERLELLRPGLPVVVGGFAVRVAEGLGLYLDGGVLVEGKVDYEYYQYLLDLVDCFIIGEGEPAFENVLRLLAAGETLPEGLPGVWTRETTPETFVPQKLLVDVNAEPWPTYGGFELDRYNEGRYRVLPVLTARGCVRRCAFCTDVSFWQRFRSREVATVLAELEHHYTVLETRSLHFNDLALNGDMRAFKTLLDGIAAKGYRNLAWAANALVRPSMADPALAKQLRKACCDLLIFGVEAGSDRVLRAMRKGFSRADALAAFPVLAAEGIKLCINIIVGFPGEEEEDFLQTLSLVEELRPYVTEVHNANVLQITPGSALEKDPRHFGLELPAREHHKLWSAKDNTPALRSERLQRLLELCATLKLPVLCAAG